MAFFVSCVVRTMRQRLLSHNFVRPCSKDIPTTIEEFKKKKQELEVQSTVGEIDSSDVPTTIEEFKKKQEELEEESAASKTGRIMKDELIRLSKFDLSVPEPKIPKHVDFLIVGGGIIGSSIAYWMKSRARDSFDLMVAERDPKYTRSSSVLSVGGIRQQFSLPENIYLSLYSMDFLRNIKQHLSVLDDDPPDIQFQPHGYLFLASEAGAQQMEQNHDIQIDCGAKVELLNPKLLATRFPWLNTDGIALGSYGYQNEGWFDPWSLLSAFKKKSASLGAKYIHGEVIGFEIEKVSTAQFDYCPSAPDLEVHFAYLRDPTGEIHCVEFSQLIVACGPFSADIAKMLNIGSGPGLLNAPLPVEPRKRYVYTFHCDEGPGLDMPLVIDPSGAYCRREGLGGMYIAGMSPKESEEPDNSNLDVDYKFFDDAVWPPLAQRIPAFEAIKTSSAWAGYYDYNTLDQNAIVGFHPFYNNVCFVTGFSGHGIQMAPAVGRTVMELLLDQEFRTVDLSRFSMQRLFNNKPILEKNIV